MTSDAAALQEDEATALEAIYGDAVTVLRDERRVRVVVSSPHGSGEQVLVLEALLPSDYPLGPCAPLLELHGGHLADDLRAWAVHQMEGLFVQGDVALYNCVEWLKEQEVLWPAAGAGPAAGGQEAADDDGEAAAVAARQARSAAASSSDRGGAAVREQDTLAALRALGVTSGEAHIEKKSTFQAHAAVVHSFEEVQAVMDALLGLSKVRAATHNIMAYRIVAPGGQVAQDYDDDGEAAAGGRLLHLLQAADVRNVMVVVSRWFGGVLMGPARFPAINNTARALLEQLGHMGSRKGGAPGGGGKDGPQHHAHHRKGK